jgi:hypothetical protein
MAIKMTVKHDVELECYVLEYGQSGAEDIVCLQSSDYEEAIAEAREILDDWFYSAV